MISLFFSLIIESNSQACSQFKCETKDYPSLDESECYYQSPLTGVIYPRPCKYGYQCFYSSNSYTCQYPSSYTPGTKVAGTKCEYDQDCVPNNLCINKKCEGLPLAHPCTSHLDCDVGLYCSPINSTCTLQLQIGQTGCLEDSYCVNNAGCQVYSPTNPLMNICTKYFSLDDYHALQGCSVSGEINYLCESGFCINFGVSICYPAPKLLLPTSEACSTDSDCKSSETGMFNLIFNSSCQCGLNSEGNKYCSLLPGDSIYNDYDSMVKEWINSKYIKNCNTYGRFGKNCMETYWGSKKTQEFTYKEFKAMNFTSFYNAEDCALETIYPGYLDLESEYGGLSE